MENKNKGNNFFLNFLAGVAVGTVLGILYAPRRGSETRKKITDKTNELTDDLQDITRKTVGTIGDLRERIMDVISDLTRGNAGEAIFDSFGVRGNWNEIKGKLKKKYSNLSDDDLEFLEGKENELVGKLQKKLGKTKDEIIDIFEGLQGKKQPQA